MTTLQALAHGPASRYELSFILGRSAGEIADEIWDSLYPQGLVESETMRDGVFTWKISPVGREELAHQAQRRRDGARECVGVRP